MGKSRAAIKRPDSVRRTRHPDGVAFCSNITSSVGFVAVMAYLGYFNIRTTSPLLHGDDVRYRSYSKVFHETKIDNWYVWLPSSIVVDLHAIELYAQWYSIFSNFHDLVTSASEENSP